MEDVTNEYCKDLLWRSFFQEAREDSFGNIISFKMHDLIHDLAQSISRIECTYIDSNIENVNENVRHLSNASHNVPKKDLSSLFKAKKIRTLILRIDLMAFKMYQARDLGEEESSCQKSTLEKLFSSLSCLRALDLLGSDIMMVPNSIEKLTFLKYHDLSRNNIKVLPNSITSFFLRNHPKRRGDETISLKDISKVHRFSIQGNFLHPNLVWGELTS